MQEQRKSESKNFFKLFLTPFPSSMELPTLRQAFFLSTLYDSYNNGQFSLCAIPKVEHILTNVQIRVYNNNNVFLVPASG